MVSSTFLSREGCPPRTLGPVSLSRHGPVRRAGVCVGRPARCAWRPAACAFARRAAAASQVRPSWAVGGCGAAAGSCTTLASRGRRRCAGWSRLFLCAPRQWAAHDQGRTGRQKTHQAYTLSRPRSLPSPRHLPRSVMAASVITTQPAPPVPAILLPCVLRAHDPQRRLHTSLPLLAPSHMHASERTP